MLLFPGWKLSRINLGSAYLLSAASIYSEFSMLRFVQIPVYIFMEKKYNDRIFDCYPMFIAPR